MRIAVISDTHFGDHQCQIAYKENNAIVKGPKYNELVNALSTDEDGREYSEPLDYLVLAGDIFDFAISSYQEAYETGQAFFKWIKSDNIAKEIIYIAGNHDFDIWHTVEYEVNVIQKIRDRGEIPNLFKMALPGIIDDRGGNETDLLLPGVTVHPKNGAKYAGLFLDSITLPEGKTTFNFVYPNLYLVTPDGDSILITHGQYLEGTWSCVSEIGEKLEPVELKSGDLKKMVAVNFPTSQLLSSGVGQAGPLTGVVNRIEHEVVSKDVSTIKKYLNVFDKEIDEYIKEEVKGLKREIALILEDKIYDILKKIILKKITSIDTARYSKDFMSNEETRERFVRFYDASCGEIDSLNNQGLDLPYPKTVIFPLPLIIGFTSIYATS